MAITDDVTAANERADRGPGFGLPPPDTGSAVLDALARLFLFAIHVERRFDPFFRPALRRGSCATRSRR